MGERIQQVKLEPTAEEEVLRATSIMRMIPIIKDWPSVKNESFITVRHGIIINSWVLVFGTAANVVIFIDPSLIDIKHYLQFTCLVPLFTLWFIMRLEIVAKILKTSFEAYYLMFNVLVFILCHIVVQKATPAVTLALVTFILTVTPFLTLSDSFPSHIRASSTIFGLILLVIFVAMECLLVIFNQELSLDYDLSSDNILKLGGTTLTISGLLLSSGSAMIAFSLKNVVALIQDPTHLLLISSRIAAVETGSEAGEVTAAV